MKDILRQRLIKWRREPVVVTIDSPTRLDKARSLGYKAKQGFILVRARIEAGGRKRPSIPKGRKPKRYARTKITAARNLQAIAEQRANQKYPNLEVLNSYFVAGDSKSKWFEIIMLDKHHPAIQNDKDVSWITHVSGRSYRGMTSAGRRSRGARRVESKTVPKRSQKWKTRMIRRRG